MKFSGTEIFSGRLQLKAAKKAQEEFEDNVYRPPFETFTPQFITMSDGCYIIGKNFVIPEFEAREHNSVAYFIQKHIKPKTFGRLTILKKSDGLPFLEKCALYCISNTSISKTYLSDQFAHLEQMAFPKYMQMKKTILDERTRCWLNKDDLVLVFGIRESGYELEVPHTMGSKTIVPKEFVDECR